MSEIELVNNAELVTRIFGHWPSFHDAEVHAILLERGVSNGPILHSRIHVHELTDEIDEHGFFILINHSMVALRFTEVEIDQWQPFNAQNVLGGLEITRMERAPGEQKLLVHFWPCFGFATLFTCALAEVVAVEAYTPSR